MNYNNSNLHFCHWWLARNSRTLPDIIICIYEKNHKYNVSMKNIKNISLQDKKLDQLIQQIKNLRDGIKFILCDKSLFFFISSKPITWSLFFELLFAWFLPAFAKQSILSQVSIVIIWNNCKNPKYFFLMLGLIS